MPEQPGHRVAPVEVLGGLGYQQRNVEVLRDELANLDVGYAGILVLAEEGLVLAVEEVPEFL